MELMWGQHPAFGPPFIDESCVIDLPGGRVHCTDLTPNTRFAEGVYHWPNVPGVGGGTIDLRHVASAAADTTDTLRLDGLPEGWYAVTNTRREVGIGMAWPLEAFPALWFWQVYGGAYGPPWYGRTYNIALEPFSTVQTHPARRHPGGHRPRPRAGSLAQRPLLRRGLHRPRRHHPHHPRGRGRAYSVGATQHDQISRTQQDGQDGQDRIDKWISSRSRSSCASLLINDKSRC